MRSDASFFVMVVLWTTVWLAIGMNAAELVDSPSIVETTQ